MASLLDPAEVALEEDGVPRADGLVGGQEDPREQVAQEPLGRDPEHQAGDARRRQQGHAELLEPVELLERVDRADGHEEQRQGMSPHGHLGDEPAAVASRFTAPPDDPVAREGHRAMKEPDHGDRRDEGHDRLEGEDRRAGRGPASGPRGD